RLVYGHVHRIRCTRVFVPGGRGGIGTTAPVRPPVVAYRFGLGLSGKRRLVSDPSALVARIPCPDTRGSCRNHSSGPGWTVAVSRHDSPGEWAEGQLLVGGRRSLRRCTYSEMETLGEFVRPAHSL